LSIIKSFSVGNGDMFYIKHNSDNFTIIDCCLEEPNKEEITEEIIRESIGIGVQRFISTHPDEDHIKGLGYLFDRCNILNFYCVKNKAVKEERTDDFIRYCELRDNKKAFYIYKGCSRKWMNLSGKGRDGSGINILWPNTDNKEYLKELKKVGEGSSPNNISPIITYSLNNGATVMWMGDIEQSFLENVKEDIEFDKINILFAPHHGRKSGKLPNDVLDELNPNIIVIGEAPSEDLEYYPGYNTITQNRAGDIVFECLKNKVRIYVSGNYSLDCLVTETDCDSKSFLKITATIMC